MNVIENGNLAQINSWLTYNPALFYKYAPEINKRLYFIRPSISSEENTPTATDRDIDAFCNTIMLRSNFTEFEYKVLRSLANNVWMPETGAYDTISSENISIRNIVILTSLLDSERIIQEKSHGIANYAIICKNLYQYIMDFYIPSSNPAELIETFITQSDLSDLVRNSYNSDYIPLKFESYGYSMNLKEACLLHRYISDIYNVQEAKIEFLKNIHDYLQTDFYKHHDTCILANRYAKYLNDENDEAYRFIEDTFYLLTYRSMDDYEEIDYWIKLYGWKYSKILPLNILKVLLNQITQVIISNDLKQVRRDHIREIVDEIICRWEEPHFEPDEMREKYQYHQGIDNPITILEQLTREADEMDVALEAKKEVSARMNSAEKKIYKAYKTYKNAEEKVDSQITKGANALKGVVTGNVREEIIEGKKFSAIGLLKKLLGTVALFSYSKIKFVIFLVIRFALKKSTTESERKKILMEIDTEIVMLEEKINDARGDNNRQAKYAMMRTKKELENAKVRIEFGMSADRKSLSDTRKQLDKSRAERTVK